MSSIPASALHTIQGFTDDDAPPAYKILPLADYDALVSDLADAVELLRRVRRPVSGDYVETRDLLDAFIGRHMSSTERVQALLQEAMDSDLHGPRIREILVEIDDHIQDKPTNYTGPDPIVRCAYEPCTNHLRRSEFPGPQWCSQAHRSATPLDRIHDHD